MFPVSCVFWRTPADTVMIIIMVLTVKTTAPPDVYLGHVTKGQESARLVEMDTAASNAF